MPQFMRDDRGRLFYMTADGRMLPMDPRGQPPGQTIEFGRPQVTQVEIGEAQVERAPQVEIGEAQVERQAPQVEIGEPSKVVQTTSSVQELPRGTASERGGDAKAERAAAKEPPAGVHHLPGVGWVRIKGR